MKTLWATLGESKLKRVARFGIAAALALAASMATAHHSFAMFDLGKDVTVEAVVKEVQFTNPHFWLQLSAGSRCRIRGSVGSPSGWPGHSRPSACTGR